MRGEYRWEHMGLSLSGGRMVWSLGHGFGGWLPKFLRHAIVTAWNRAACRVLGHQIFDFSDEGDDEDGHWVIDDVPSCVSCCREFPKEKIG